jgi:hypothetical protein
MLPNDHKINYNDQKRQGGSKTSHSHDYFWIIVKLSFYISYFYASNAFISDQNNPFAYLYIYTLIIFVPLAYDSFLSIIHIQ